MKETKVYKFKATRNIYFNKSKTICFAGGKTYTFYQKEPGSLIYVTYHDETNMEHSADIEWLLDSGFVNEVVKAPEPITYKIGDTFVRSSGLAGEQRFILANIGKNHMVVLIMTKGFDIGNRWAGLVKVNDLTKITEEEFSDITGNKSDEFEFIKE